MIEQVKAHLRGTSLKARAMRGSIITFAGFGGAQVLRLASNLILTRILVPEYFGLMALVQVVMTAVAMFSDVGVHTSILQDKRGDDPVFLDTAWVIQILRGMLLWGLVAASAPTIAEFYNQPELASLLPIAGFGALLTGLRSTKAATAGRHLALGRLTLIELGAQVLGLIALILLSLWLQSVWALVIGGLIGQAFGSLFSHLYLPGINNRIRFEGAAFRSLFSFGKFIFLSSIVGFMVNQGDRAVLGKFVTMTDLGVYNIGFFLATVPLLLTRQFNNRILIPLYREKPPAGGPDNFARIRKARIGLTGAMLMLSVLLALLGDWLVQALYTAPYYGAGPVLVLLALTSIPFIISNAYSGLYLGTGHSRDFTLQLTATALIQMTALYFGVKAYGLLGAVIAPAIAALLSYPITAYFAKRHKGWDPVLDVSFFCISLLAAALVFWLHPDVASRLINSN